MTFHDFHAANPHVYTQLVALAREWKAKGHTKCGIAMLYEVVRWRRGLQTTGGEYLLNNNYKAHYARLIMTLEPDLDNLFELRASPNTQDDES